MEGTPCACAKENMGSASWGRFSYAKLPQSQQDHRAYLTGYSLSRLTGLPFPGGFRNLSRNFCQTCLHKADAHI